MTLRIDLSLLAVALAGSMTAAHAQTLDVKPGLWETTSTTDTGGMPSMDLSKVPAEQRARMEAAMKARMGKPTTNRSCMTKEKLEKGFQDQKDADSSCKRTMVVNTRSVQEIKFECENPRKTSGTLHFEALSRESVKGTVKIVSTDGTRSMNINSSIEAKWLGDNCGDTK